MGGKLSTLEAEYNAVKDNMCLAMCRQRYTDESGATRNIGGMYYPAGLAALPRSLPRLLPAPPPSYEIRNAPGKGLGVFATRNIAFGEIIIVERPLIVLPMLLGRSARSESEARETILRTMSDLVEFFTPDEQKMFLSLSNAKQSLGLGETFCIVKSNGIKFRLPGVPESYVSVCLTLSRVNHRYVTNSFRSLHLVFNICEAITECTTILHSCGPNASFGFDSKTFSMCLLAGRDIPALTEITASYCPKALSRMERMRILEERYRFTCTCQYCARPSAASDRARMELQNWGTTHLMFYQWLATPNRDPNTLLLSSSRALSMIKKEGMESGYSVIHYENLAGVYGARGDAAMLKYWLWKLILAYPLDTNRDASVTQYLQWISDPERNYPFWAVLARA
jgi:SET domain